MSWRTSVLTLFPEMFPGPLAASLIGKAMQSGLWSLDVHDIRDNGIGRHRTVDDTPSGGGPGMVMRADVAAAAIDAVRNESDKRPLLYPSPRGVPFSQARAVALAEGPGAIFLCGRFEGVDERVLQARQVEEISLGDFVLMGGEVAAMAMIEASVRLLPGAIGKDASKTEESFASGLLEYPHYTRPQVFENIEIPEVLSSGDHAAMARWRQAEAERLTKLRRPDLWTLYEKRLRSARTPGSMKAGSTDPAKD